MNAVLQLSVAALGRKVDQLGEINGQIAALRKRADALKDALIESGEGEIEGKLFRAVISPRSSVKLDSKLAKQYLTVAEIAACSKVVESVNVTLYDL